jgi:hypothetical protein
MTLETMGLARADGPHQWQFGTIWKLR